jgi:hypothetical protein
VCVCVFGGGGMWVVNAVRVQRLTQGEGVGGGVSKWWQAVDAVSLAHLWRLHLLS